MREDFLERLRCPACLTDRSFVLVDAASDALEVREGRLRCRSCGHAGRIGGGIVDLMYEPPEFVMREAAGLARFAEEMRRDGWDRERILALPYQQDGYWYAQATAMHQTLHQQPLRPGEWILDVGSNSCWASATFAAREMNTVALDIVCAELQGLATADWWMQAKSIHFERLCSLMFALALASESFDWVWCCEVLHHNHHANLRRTMSELYRVLKPGGKLLVVNETLRSLRYPGLSLSSDAAANIEQWDGHEHSYLRGTYLRAARRAGFTVEVKGPWYLDAFREDDFVIEPTTTSKQAFTTAFMQLCRRRPRWQFGYLAAKSYLLGGSALFFVATRPG